MDRGEALRRCEHFQAVLTADADAIGVLDFPREEKVPEKLRLTWAFMPQLDESRMIPPNLISETLDPLRIRFTKDSHSIHRRLDGLG